MNNFDKNANDYIQSIRPNIRDEFYLESKSVRESNKAVDIIKVTDR